MGDKSAIQWTDATWNPIAGCSLAGPDCTNCYAMREAHRLARIGMDKYRGLTTVVNGHPVWTGEVRSWPPHLLEPLHWAKPRRIFVNSMSDLFHEDLGAAIIDRVFAVMALAPQHMFQLLTKRAARMKAYLTDPRARLRIYDACEKISAELHGHRSTSTGVWPVWPLANLSLLVSVGNQKAADERLPFLIETPAAIRGISCEPLIGPIDLRSAGVVRHFEPPATGPGCHDGPCDDSLVDWVIVGGESGKKARPMHPDWARSLRDQCASAEIAFFFKQWGEWIADGHPIAEDEGLGTCGGPEITTIIDTPSYYRVGKKRAGRELDGRTHDEFPEASKC